MGYVIWHDQRNDYAGYLCTTSDTTVPLPQVFSGPECYEQAEDFLDYIGDDPRSFRYDQLCVMHDAWWKLAFDEDDNFRPVCA